jgi:hypothetical protein
MLVLVGGVAADEVAALAQRVGRLPPIGLAAEVDIMSAITLFMRPGW